MRRRRPEKKKWLAQESSLGKNHPNLERGGGNQRKEMGMREKKEDCAIRGRKIKKRSLSSKFSRGDSKKQTLS